jgi:hypothetical protein
MEIELGWGVHDLGEYDRLSMDGRTERGALSDLLATLDQTRIPITFDTVGHLLLEGCSGDHDSPHENGWFRSDPGTDYHTDGLFYAPDMVAEIQSRSVDHELCTHTFSHVLLDRVSEETCRWELDQVEGVHRQTVGQPPRSLVPPRHLLPTYDLLVDYGIDVVRPAMEAQSTTRRGRFAELFAGPLPRSDLRRHDGLVETTCTTYPSLTAPALPSGQGVSHPAFRYIPLSIRKHTHLRKLKQATRAVTADGGHLHLWCHLFDLCNPHQSAVVDTYLDWLAAFRAKNDLTVAPMKDLPAYV